jgi:hypothetical protein
MRATNILVQSGIVLIGAALLSAELAWLHMQSMVQTYGAICGSGPGAMAHCAACYASVAFLAAGAAALAWARERRLPKRAAAPLRVTSSAVSR